MKGFWITALVLLLAGCSNLPAEAPADTNEKSVAAQWLSQSIPEIALAIRQGDISTTALVKAYQRRIAAIDRSGPALSAVLALNPNALEEAQALDELLASGEHIGPLHGVPVLLKDNIESRGPLPTTAGSTALMNNITHRDSPLVTGLRAAGALILGKANLSQWANFRSAQSLSGWSAIGGQVRNPHILDRNPCGSSSGSGAAVAAALTAAAVGTETNGSIICPSNANGIVGFKPTVGLVSAKHIVPISFTQDTAGPMTRSVAGAALMLDAMTGDAGNATYSAPLQSASLKDKRLGVLRYSQGSHPGIVRRFDAALQILESAGATLINISERPDRPDNFGTSAQTVMVTEFKHSLNDYLASTPGAIKTRTLKQLIAFNMANAEVELSLFGQDIFEKAELTQGIDDPDYQSALQLIRTATQDNGIDAMIAEYNLEALVFPSGPLTPPIDAINGDVWPSWVGDGSNAAIAGYPHLTVPMGTVNAAPIGLSFVASAGEDAKVLSLGHAFEQISQLRVEPNFLPTARSQPNVDRAMQPMTPAMKNGPNR